MPEAGRCSPERPEAPPPRSGSLFGAGPCKPVIAVLELSILFPSLLNGLTTGAVYALIALGLTLIYGVLHIINFAHGALLMIALYGVFFLNAKLGLDACSAVPIIVPGMFALGC